MSSRPRVGTVRRRTPEESASSRSQSPPQAGSTKISACLECRRLKRRVRNRTEAADDSAIESYHATSALDTKRRAHSLIGAGGQDTLKERVEELERLLSTPSADTHASPSKSIGQSPIVPTWTPPHSAPISLETQGAMSSEALAALPSSSKGYEWNERWPRPSERINDGHASMTRDAEGKGYLGFACGSTMLRILQICAGSLSLATVDLAPSPERNSPRELRPSDSELSTYVDSYFEHYHRQYPILHEPTFRAQWMDLVPRPTSRDWLFLVDIVLCIGAFCHSQLNLTTDYFLNSALNRITSEHLEAGSLTLVQAYCLLSDISHKRDKPNAGSVYMGVALRMAIGLGLHLELPLWKITPFEAELRRRVWWTAIALDASASMTLGRPIVEPTVTPSVHPVRNVNDCSFTTATIAPPDESSEPTTYTAIKYHSQFHAYTTRIYQRITANVPLCAAEALTLDQELLDWLGTVPACFKPNRDDSLPHWHSFGQYRLQWRHGNLRMILHRGAFLSLAISNSPLWDRPEQPNLEIESCRLCLVAAAETISSIGDLCDRRQTRSRLEGWYALHFLLHPTYIILVALYCDPTSSQRAVWESIVDRACHVLQYCPKDPAAEKCLRMIRLLRSSLASGAATGELHDANAQLIDMQESSSWIAMIGLQSQQASNTLSMADLSTLNSFWNERGQQ